jgi:hypothetical protein
MASNVEMLPRIRMSTRPPQRAYASPDDLEQLQPVEREQYLTEHVEVSGTPPGGPPVVMYHERDERNEEMIVRDTRRYQERSRSPMREVNDDKYGRVARPELRGKNGDRFFQILPENPFSVRHAPPPGTPRHSSEFRDMPILQFWTWRMSLNIIPPEDVRNGDNEELCRCSIADAAGDWCGSIVLNSKWIREQSSTGHFIAMSEAKAFTMEECPTWTYYIPKERGESEWDLYYVLLITPNNESLVWERVALGKVFRAAFSEDKWSEIKLG